jgi:6-phosphogluconolactonase
MRRVLRTSLPSVASLPVIAALASALGATACSSPADSTTTAASADLSADTSIGHAGTVYTLTNDATTNELLVYGRSSDGSLRPAATYVTGGRGSGVGLGSQSAVFLNGDGSWLFAVNAGSNELSAFRVEGATLRLVDCLPSGGEGPLSVTEHDGLVYVLNAGGTGSISGFTVGADGHLHALARSTQSLSSGAAGAAQIAFDHEGRTLFVTEKASSTLDRFAVDVRGRASAAVSVPSAGQTPFGFAVTAHDQLIVSQAFGGAAGASAVSSYSDGSGALTPVSSAIADTQSAACWINLLRGGTLALTSNTGSGTISTYGVAGDGSLTLVDATAASTGDGSKPEDMALSADERFLYVLEAGSGQLGIFAVGASGGLTSRTPLTGLPPATTGLAAR